MWKHGLVPVLRSTKRKGYKEWKLFNLGEATLIMKKGKLQLDFEYRLEKEIFYLPTPELILEKAYSNFLIEKIKINCELKFQVFVTITANILI